MSDASCDVAIVGAGIVGLAVGLQLLRAKPALRVVVLEKEDAVAAHQTGHNSGVLHSGIYYKPGSLKARLCVEGRAAMVAFCREYGIPHAICGKIVVATEERELPGLHELLRRAQANGVAGLREIGPEEIRAIEPAAAGIRALHVPGTGITDFRQVAEKYADLIREAGGEVLTGHAVVSIAREATGVVLETTGGAVHARFAINCAGLHSDRIATMAGAALGLRIVPFRGEYYEIVPAKHDLVRGLIYPVADPRFPFLGVHFTRRIVGGVEAGPNAVFAFRREGYTRTSFSLRDTLSAAAFPGFWKMAAQNWQSGMGEMARSWSKRAFTRSLQRLVPAITESDLGPGGSGVRAQALDRSGRLLDDFHFVTQDRFLHVCNVPSPAATASLVIGREIVATLMNSVDLDRLQVAVPSAV
ncbi:MAG TPA: L-2-hydroxyglutarate oxidase [Acidobacteriaceae bacterium]|nr:L-2-hydroxyglutarate oxidase [Acidobacteriaceae bacterium]